MKMSKKTPLVFLDVSIDGDPAERMVFEVLLHYASLYYRKSISSTDAISRVLFPKKTVKLNYCLFLGMPFFLLLKVECLCN